MKVFKFLIALVILIFSIDIAYSSEAKIGEAAPNFTLTDSKGNTHSLSDFKGKIVVLEWINFDCPFVVKHYDSKNMQNLQKKFTQKGIIWLAICSSAEGKQGNFDNTEINKRIKELNANMTAYLIDESGEVGKMYQAKTTPHMYIVDSEGNLVYAGGVDDTKSTDQNDIPKSKNWVEIGLNELLSGKVISQKTSAPYGCSVKYK